MLWLPPDIAESHHIAALKIYIFYFLEDKAAGHYFAPGEMAERSNAAVLKTVDCYRSGGSNPSLSAG
jgi:hypothetical protein